MGDFNVYGIAIIPVVMGLIELLKRAGLPKRLSPLTSVIIGILVGFYYLAPGDPPKAILFGLVVGLSAVGMYSGAKNTMQHISPEKTVYRVRKKKSL